MSNPATEQALAAARDTATEEELLGAGERGRIAGELAARTGRRQLNPYAVGTLTAHVWRRWYVHSRLTGVGMPD